MKALYVGILLMLACACSSQPSRVDCDGRLQPINAPMPAAKSVPAAKPSEAARSAPVAKPVQASRPTKVEK